MLRMIITTVLIGSALAYGIIYFAQYTLNANEVRFMASLAADHVAILSPGEGSTVPSPVHFAVIPPQGHTIVRMSIYDGNSLVYREHANAIDAMIPLSAGAHKLVKVQAWDTEGDVFLAMTDFTVKTGTP